MKIEFEVGLRTWLNEVAIGCHEITTDPELKMDLDFYACQSRITYSPELLIIGANPGGGKSYKAKNNEKNRERRGANDLCNNSNQFIEHYNDTAWRNFKPLCDLFFGDILRPTFETAVITNLIYFNSGTFNAFKKRSGYKRGLNFCLKMNFDLIKLIQPKKILLMGKPVKEVFSKYLDKPLEVGLMADNNVSALVLVSSYKDIPVYGIHHPAALGGERVFNYGKHEIAKRQYFEKKWK